MNATDLLSAQGNLFTYSYSEIIINILLAIILGFIISVIYRETHKGLSYSQSFTLTILFVTVIVAVVMMVIGGSLARAFALVGALSIIRFRTVIKDLQRLDIDNLKFLAEVCIRKTSLRNSRQCGVLSALKPKTFL